MILQQLNMTMTHQVNADITRGDIIARDATFIVRRNRSSQSILYYDATEVTSDAMT